MRVLLALLLLVPAGPLSPLTDGSDSDPRQTQWIVTAQPPDPLPAGDKVVLEAILHREAAGSDVPGPGQAEVQLEAPEAAGCGPREQTVSLDPTTGEGQAGVHCHPDQPGQFALTVTADSEDSQPGSWNTTLVVEPDRLEGRLRIGDAEDHRFPVELELTPKHLQQAPVDVSLEAHLVDTALGFREPSLQTQAGGAPIERELVALHGGGEYRVQARVDGPLTEPWNAVANVSVPEPPTGATLDLDAVIEASNASVRLASDPINDDEKHKNPGQALTTRFRAEGTDYVNVTVYRLAADGTEIQLAQQFIPPDETGEVEHVFVHDPLPADTLWVQGQAGNETVQRNASIQDLDPEASVEGPGLVLRGSDEWTGSLVLQDRNFGSTSSDPGPLTGLPDLDWTVFKGRRSGSAEARGFTVEIGNHSGASNGTAPTSSITWPKGPPHVDVTDGQARVPLNLHPPPEAETRGYRLSLYENQSGDLLTTHPFALQGVDVEASKAPRPGQPWPIEVGIEDPSWDTTVELQLLRDGAPIANQSVETPSTWRPVLPSPLPAGTPLAVQVHVEGPQGLLQGTPHKTVEATVPELGPDARVHPVLDDAATQGPVALHPAHEHELEITYHAFDPNEGPLNVTDVSVLGPDGATGWKIDRIDEGRVRIDVPQGPPAGRYSVQLEIQNRTMPMEALPLDVGHIVRLAVDGPEEVTLQQGTDHNVTLSVENLGNLPVEQATVLVESPLDLDTQLWARDETVPAGQPVPVGLQPGEETGLEVTLEATGSPGQGPVNLTVAGVAS